MERGRRHGNLPSMLARSRIRWHLTEAHTGGRLLRAEVWVPAGAPPRAVHRHPDQEERMELLAGAIELQLDGVACRHERGAVIVIPAGTPHGWRNPGPDALHFMFDLELIG